METTYTYTEDLGYRKEVRVNATQFAKDLAKELGGEYQAKFENDMDKDYRGTFTLDGNRIHVNRAWNAKGKVTISIDADVDWTKTSMPYVSEYRQEYKLKEIQVSVERPLAVIAKDVKRRLIEANAAAIQARREYFKKQVGTQSTLQSISDTLQKHFGKAMRVRLEDRAEYAGTFDLTGEGVYGSGRFYADGSMGFDRLGTMSAEQFQAILRILRPNAFRE